MSSCGPPPRSESGGRFLELSCRISPPPRVTTPWVEWGGDVQLSEAPSSSSLTVCRHSGNHPYRHRLYQGQSPRRRLPLRATVWGRAVAAGLLCIAERFHVPRHLHVPVIANAQPVGIAVVDD